MTPETQSLVSEGTFLLPKSTSTLSSNVDALFYFLFWGSTVIFIGMIIVAVWFLIKYKRTESNQKASAHMIHNTALEVSWTVIPLVIVMIVFAWGYKDYLKLSVVPPDAHEVRVTGKKWLWEFEYPRDGVKLLNELVF